MEENKEKEYIVNQIKARILSEYNKHKRLDWSEIAARKIYATFDIDKKNEESQGDKQKNSSNKL